MLTPETSPIYDYSTKVVDAVNPRQTGSVILSKPSDNPADYQLKVAYRRYINKKKLSGSAEKPLINLIFMHGNGMNKGIWHYQIDKLFQKFPDTLNLVIAPDHANHGESASLNREKLGYTLSWSDFAKDILHIAKYEEKDHFLQKNVINIPVGHSMGGCISLIMGLWEEQLFDALVPINPVSYADDERLELMKMVYKIWYDRQTIQSEFKANDVEDFKKLVNKFYREKSFFKKLHPDVLENMINDELTDIQQNGDIFGKNTDYKQEFFTYFAHDYSIERLMPVMNKINTPTYLIFGELDSAAGIADETNRKLLERVLKVVEVPNATHLVNGELPDLTVDLVANIINERVDVFLKEGDKRYPDSQYLKKFGPDYRKQLIDEAYYSRTRDVKL